MELLNSRARRRASFACAALMALSAAGCMLIDQLGGGVRRYAFSHAEHVSDDGLACIDCHPGAVDGERPGMPALEVCAECHATLDASKPPELRADALYSDGVFRAAHAGAQSSEIVFPHALHAAAMACGTCHRGIEHDRDVARLERLSMDECTACHAKEKAPNECSTCHVELRREVEPPSHAADWERHHGQVVRSLGESTGDRCELCHTEAGCLQCHKEREPMSHTLHFRERGHALLASLDRESCAACHTTDTCDRCHREALPRSHMGNWSSSFAGHCLGCHFPLREEGCITCHKSMPGHRSTPKPPDHTPVMICRQCHGLVAALPHADKGDDCNGCHP
jgi:menaquinone reductase, multiheme cytochrome c subunit